MKYDFYKKPSVIFNGQVRKRMEVWKTEYGCYVFVGIFSGKTYKEIKNRFNFKEEEEEERYYEVL